MEWIAANSSGNGYKERQEVEGRYEWLSQGFYTSQRMRLMQIKHSTQGQSICLCKDKEHVRDEQSGTKQTMEF